MLEWLREFFGSADEASTSGVGGALLESGAFGPGLDAIVQLFLWFDLLESGQLNYLINFALGMAETLGGVVLISMGLRQVDLTGAEDGNELPRVARRTAGEVVKAVVGQALRLVGVVRALAAGVLSVGSLL